MNQPADTPIPKQRATRKADRALTYLAELVAMPTVTADKAACAQALDYVEKQLKGRLHTKRHVWNGYHSLVATTHPTKHPKVMLAAHLDVVPSHDNHFTLTQVGDKLMGRGVYDMKFAVASYLALFDSISEHLASYDLGMMLVTDEEIGGYDGTVQLIEEGYRADVCVLPDGGYDWSLETFAKGVAYGHVEIRGRAAHGSRPWAGDSASFKIVDFLHELKAHFEGQGPETPTINIGHVSSGRISTRIPDHASAYFDIRYMNQTQCNKIKRYIDKLLAKYDGKWLELKADPVAVSDFQNPYLQKFARHIESVTHTACVPSMSYGASDARFLSAAGIPCVMTMPPGGGHHGDDEWLSYQGFVQFREILRRFVDEVARKDLPQSI